MVQMNHAADSMRWDLAEANLQEEVAKDGSNGFTSA